MIHLCYLKRKIPDQELFYQRFLSEIFPHCEYGTDLVITSEKIQNRDGLIIMSYPEVDLESLYSMKINNIFLTEFDEMEPKFLRSLVTMKSKKTEIIGISNNYNKSYKKLQLDIQKFKDSGFTNDHISIALILKNNLPSDLVNTCMNDKRTKLKNLNVKEINKISDIVQFIH